MSANLLVVVVRFALLRVRIARVPVLARLLRLVLALLVFVFRLLENQVFDFRLLVGVKSIERSRLLRSLKRKLGIRINVVAR